MGGKLWVWLVFVVVKRYIAVADLGICKGGSIPPKAQLTPLYRFLTIMIFCEKGVHGPHGPPPGSATV